MIREELRNRIFYLLNEAIDNPTFQSAGQVNATIQEAMEIISEEVCTLRRQALIVTEPGRHWYTTYEISPTCMTPFRIFSDGVNERLDPITMPQLEDVYTQWITVNSNQPQWWYPVSFDTFGIWPGTMVGGTVLRVDYLSWPETLEDDHDEPVFKEIDQDLIILYGQYDGLIRQWEVERAMDIFNKFVATYLDTRYRSEVRRYHYMLFNRRMDAGYRNMP